MISRRWSLLAVSTVLAVGACLPGCTTGYVVRAGWYQAEMLAAREPIDEVLERGELSAGQEQRLRLVPSLKRYGQGIGLAATDNYDSLAVGWDRTVWNVSAAQALSFENETWWFPVVGRVPYLGYFVEDEARAEAQTLLDRIGLGDKANEFPDRLSGGQQQRGAMVRAIATNPRVLLLDEVTSALDPELVGEVLDLIRELKQTGVTIVMATHEMDFAKDVADRVAFLDNGVILEEGTAKQVLTKPREARTREYLKRFHASR
jgi:ABC-type dipeptide/oligopeptide/nickel transport system ATPase component